jgi:chromate transporter
VRTWNRGYNVGVQMRLSAPPRHRQVLAFVGGAPATAAGALAGAVVVLTRQAVLDWSTTARALVALALLWRWKLPEPAVVVAAGAPGRLSH